MSEFIPGLKLNELFYHEVIAPLLKLHFQELQYSAALIGWGSDVLGYDDIQSTDHNWGLRVQIFLRTQDYDKYHPLLNDALNEQLPVSFRGYPVAFEWIGEEAQRDHAVTSRHNSSIETMEGFFTRYLDFNPYDEITTSDWLAFPEHRLLAVTSGRVFYDGLGELEPIRRKFSYYPKDIWLYLLAAQWNKIFEEQAFVGRCGFVGDELGSMVIAARQVKNLMHLCFMMERKYAPYSKWFGTAFSQLGCAQKLSPIFKEVLQASEWGQRQMHLAQAYQVIASIHNALNITIPLEEKAAPYFNRPYLVVGDNRYADELLKAIESEEIKNIKYGFGSVNQLIESGDQLDNRLLRQKLKELYV